MTDRKIRILRSNKTTIRPGGATAKGNPREPGEVYANFADAQLGVVNLSKVAQDFIGVPFHSEATAYNKGQAVNFTGKLYVANQNIPIGVFEPAKWIEIDGEQNGTFKTPDKSDFTQDLNTLREDGIYDVISTPANSAVNNYPALGVCGTLIVRPLKTDMITIGARDVVQLFITGRPGPASAGTGHIPPAAGQSAWLKVAHGGEMYIRSGEGNDWTDWKIVGEDTFVKSQGNTPQEISSPLAISGGLDIKSAAEFSNDVLFRGQKILASNLPLVSPEAMGKMEVQNVIWRDTNGYLRIGPGHVGDINPDPGGEDPTTPDPELPDDTAPVGSVTKLTWKEAFGVDGPIPTKYGTQYSAVLALKTEKLEVSFRIPRGATTMGTTVNIGWPTVPGVTGKVIIASGPTTVPLVDSGSTTMASLRLRSTGIPAAPSNAVLYVEGPTGKELNITLQASAFE